jgi:DnaK suppressor protein
MTTNKTTPAAKVAPAAAKAATVKTTPAKSLAVQKSELPTSVQKAPSQKSTAAKKAATFKTGAVATAASKPVASASPTLLDDSQPAKAAVGQTVKPSLAKSMSVTPVESVQSPVEQVSAADAAAPEQLVRAARPSARLAQLTVPSLPPAVASTAAKSSFLPGNPPAPAPMAFVPIKKDPKLANNWKSKKVHELSDAEVLAMPDEEYMNDMQMAYFRLKLSLLKQEILASAGQTTEHLREDTVVVPDPADRATIEEEHALELRTRDRERKLLKKIEQSIQRIDAGDYGFCDETGEAIGVGRLMARPTATLSLEAQQRRELKQKMFGD